MKKLLVILIVLWSTVELYAPEGVNDSGKKLESWLSSSELTIDHLKLAIEVNGIIAPQIVFAQGCLETGHFNSDLCTGHNNLFGMKKARVRQTTALGSTDNDYASYLSWYDSVKDMKLFQEWYLSKGRDLTDYFGFLAAIGYAEDPFYIPKVKMLCSISR
jgi:flagellum-specific peptidoglycan hydrolase FlgJ